MRHTILGAGGIGGLIGAVLAKAGHQEHADRAADLLGTPGLRRDNLLDSVVS